MVCTLVAGFAALLALMVVLTYAGVNSMGDAQARLDDVVRQHLTKVHLVSGMRSASRERTVLLQQMLLATDPFDFDELVMQFNLHGGEFARLRTDLVGLIQDDREWALLKHQGELAGIAIPLQRDVIEKIETGRRSEAGRLLLEQAVPAQQNMYAVLDELITLQTMAADAAVARAGEKYGQARESVLLLSVAAIGLGLAIALGVFIYVRRAEARLWREEERAQVTLHSISEAVIRTDSAACVEYLNPAAEKLTGWSNDEAVMRPLSEVLHVLDDAAREPLEDPALQAVVRGAGVSNTRDALLVSRSGQEYAVELTAAALHGDDGHTPGAVVVFRDVTDVRALGRDLVYRATHDPMTGIYNRREFERRLQLALESSRDHGIEHALCYLDLDFFKTINDTCGHLAGDELLKQISMVLRRRVRSKDVLARVGGDEFALLLDDCSLDTAGRVAGEMGKSLHNFRFNWEGTSISTGASIGVVRVAADSGSLDEVLRAADVACRVAKEDGRNCVHVLHANDFTVERRQREINWVQRLHRAIETGAFELYGQPIHAFSRDVPAGPLSEVLLRLNDEGQLIAPGAFLPAAERYHLMPAIDRWVVRAVIRALQDMPPEVPGAFTVNLSGQTLCDAGFLDFVEEALKESGVETSRLCFEITETVAVTHMSRAARLIGRLREVGCRFALDDFGSGLSSFNYLKNMAVDFLKIDGAFVRNVPEDSTDRALVTSINDVAHIMGIRTIAECVENGTIHAALKRIGVDYGQGVGLSPPQPLPQVIDGIIAMAAKNRAASGPA